MCVAELVPLEVLIFFLKQTLSEGLRLKVKNPSQSLELSQISFASSIVILSTQPSVAGGA